MRRCLHCGCRIPDTKREDAEHCSRLCAQRSWHEAWRDANDGVSYHTAYAQKRKAQEAR